MLSLLFLFAFVSMLTVYFVDRFCADEELSEVLSKLWDLDDNKCYPGVEYEIDLQGKYHMCTMTTVKDLTPAR